MIEQRFGERQQIAPVAVGQRRERRPRFLIQRQGAALEGLGFQQQRLQRLVVQALPARRPGCATAALHSGSNEGFSVVAPTRVTILLLNEREEAVLLGAVETVDLVDEEQGRLAGQAPHAGLFERLLQVGDPGEHRRELLELIAGLLGQQA